MKRSELRQMIREELQRVDEAKVVRTKDVEKSIDETENLVYLYINQLIGSQGRNFSDDDEIAKQISGAFRQLRGYVDKVASGLKSSGVKV